MGDKELETGMDRSMPLLLMVNVGNRLPGSPLMDIQKDLLGCLTCPQKQKAHVEEVYTQGGLQPRPQYEKHLGIDGGQSSFFFGISTGGHENKTFRGLRYQRP